MASELYEKGKAIRREVLGEAYADSSLASADELSRPLLDLIVEFCWGAVWGRPGLPRKTRSLINVAMITALNRPHELELHVRAALRNGCSKQELGEVVLQAAVYCGAPAAVDAMRVLRQVVKEEAA